MWSLYVVFTSTVKQLTDQPDENIMYLRVTSVISAVSLADYRCGSCYSLDAEADVLYMAACWVGEAGGGA